MSLPCRSYDPPGLWCAPCRANRTDLCEDPMKPMTAEQYVAIERANAEYAAKKAAKKHARRERLRVMFSFGSATVIPRHRA